MLHNQKDKSIRFLEVERFCLSNSAVVCATVISSQRYLLYLYRCVRVFFFYDLYNVI